MTFVELTFSEKLTSPAAKSPPQAGVWQYISRGETAVALDSMLRYKLSAVHLWKTQTYDESVELLNPYPRKFRVVPPDAGPFVI